MASEKELFITKQYIPIGEPLVQNESKVIYRVKCMTEPGQPVGILKMYRKKNIQNLYGRLKHLDYSEWPHIYAVKYYDDNTLVVEEMLNGSTLAELLERNRARGAVFSEEEAKRIMDEICYVVNTLSKAVPPLYHNNLKPSNIFITRTGAIKLLDFEPDNSKRRTTMPGILNTLGILFHEMLTGRKPLNGKCTYKGRYKPVICKCIDKKPENTYTTIGELLEDLDYASTHMPAAENAEDTEKVGIPYTLTLPFQGFILALEWLILNYSYFRDNRATTTFFALIFSFHLLLFIFRRHQHLKKKQVYLPPLRRAYPFIALAALLGLISFLVYSLIS